MAMTAKQRNMQDATLINVRAQKKRIATLEAEVKKIKHAFGLAMKWIAETPGGPLSAQNAAELIEKIT